MVASNCRTPFATKELMNHHCSKVSLRIPEGYTTTSCTMRNSHQEVTKIMHTSDINKNRMFLKNCLEEKEKMGQEGCQEAYSNFKGTLSGKYWFLRACNDYLTFLFYGPGARCKLWSDFGKTYIQSLKICIKTLTVTGILGCHFLS